MASNVVGGLLPPFMDHLYPRVKGLLLCLIFLFKQGMLFSHSSCICLMSEIWRTYGFAVGWSGGRSRGMPHLNWLVQPPQLWQAMLWGGLLPPFLDHLYPRVKGLLLCLIFLFKQGLLFSHSSCICLMSKIWRARG
jgi:hypothetical protein